ncbi:hypothetical protein CHLNCDRAFT_139038 [Chlorella variabilis]|uniref:Tic22-like family protein n=1 Tax=Chlorella variabilis TaxID=554065 RepID=E1ZPN6_CHLVA|nr:hypothetical protein CHLNCDRAFT_139038 [Chlorella variabilis]EFN52292.1 hypothetical protein CHLNCDRAFT_139038 [Chlorella variabilis]|eukprot:XP_005844394.1 hypothetical protein CHLNCDRAFT_139038 [Chlorella variabilis]
MDLRSLHDNVRRNVAQIASNLRQASSRAAELCQQALMPPPGNAPLLASVSAQAGGGAGRPAEGAAQPLFDLGFNPETIKARLSAVPVFAVVNNKNEFVLVAGEDQAKQLGLFFFSEPEASAMLQTIKGANPKLGKQAKVMATSMDRVYEFAATPRGETGTEGVVFRFVPDPRQVESALELYSHAGVPATGFQGVPLFQAEGLTIRGEKERYTPLFFSKQDLDSALGAAFSSKDAAALAEARAKAERARGELQAAEGEVAAAAAERGRKAAQRKAGQAKERLQKYEQRIAEAATNKKLPRVDVGSLEEVIGRMERDDRGEWSDVVFVPPRSVAAQ